MHLNPLNPNILHDMQAAANGRDLRDGKRITAPNGRTLVLPSAKRHLVLRNNYPYSSERQVIRQRIQLVQKQKRKHILQGIEFGFIPKAADKIDWDNDPRCGCGHLFEICNHPNCPMGDDQ